MRWSIRRGTTCLTLIGDKFGARRVRRQATKPQKEAYLARNQKFESDSLQRRVTRTSTHFGPARGSKWVTAGPSAAGGDILAGFRPI